MTKHQWCVVVLTWEQFHRKGSRYLPLTCVRKWLISKFRLQPHIPTAMAYIYNCVTELPHFIAARHFAVNNCGSSWLSESVIVNTIFYNVYSYQLYYCIIIFAMSDATDWEYCYEGVNYFHPVTQMCVYKPRRHWQLRCGFVRYSWHKLYC